MRRAHGFTMVELMTTMAIVIVLGMMAGPAFTSMVANYKSRSASSDLFTALVRARSEAIKRGVDVTVTPVGGSWAAGWSSRAAGSPDNLDQHNALSSVTTSGPTSIQFGSSGRVRSTSVPKITITASDNTSRCVKVDLSGRATTLSGACT
jgi:type IV fimbrial biogenesis protein FimT